MKDFKFENMTAKVSTEHELKNDTTLSNAEVRINKERREIEVRQKKRRWSNNLRIYAQEGVKVMTRKDGGYMLYCEMESDCGKQKKELMAQIKRAVEGAADYEKYRGKSGERNQ